MHIDQSKEMNIDQPKEMNIDQSKEMNIDQSKEMNENKLSESSQTKAPLSLTNHDDHRHYIRENPLKEFKSGFYAQTGAEKQLQNCFDQKISVDIQLDCHGLTVNQSIKKINSLFEQCDSHHWRLIHLIHGIGQGILKTSIIEYLLYRSDIIGLCQAPTRLGGVGALLILMKKQRS